MSDTRTSSAPCPSLCARAAARIADLALLVDGSETDEPTIALGEALASGFDSHLDVFFANHIDPPPMATAPGADAIAARIMQEGRQIGDEGEARLKSRLERLSTASEFRRADGTFSLLVQRLVHLAGTCDMVVFSQAATVHAGQATLLEAVLFDAGSPILLAPAAAEKTQGLPSRVLVGWRDTPECAHAVAAALPILKRAESTILASVAEEGAQAAHGRSPMSDMARHLARHGVKVETRELARWPHPAEGLLHEAGEAGAEMIVAGAYGHSRLRQWLLGGVTRDLLAKSHVPLLLAH